MITSLDQLDMEKTYSYADYLTWKFDEYVELIRGRISRMGAPSSDHQRLVLRLGSLLDQFLEDSPCKAFPAPFDVRLLDNKKSTFDNDIFTVVQPDLCVVCDESKIDKKGCLGSPDLVIEILSPSTKKKDIEDKFALYEYNGIGEYWLISVAEETVIVFDLDEKGVYQFRKIYADEAIFIHSKVVKGFHFELGRLFAAKSKKKN